MAISNYLNGIRSVVKFPSRVKNHLIRHSRLDEVARWANDRYIDSPSDKSVVVSLTTYGLRIESVHMAIRSILMQTVKPSKVVLYLDESIHRDDIPNKLSSLENSGLEIRTGYEDLGPHKKYLFAFRDFPNSLVVTIDDDQVYPADTIETLVAAHDLVPSSVVARRCHRVQFASDDKLLPYEQWDWEYRDNHPIPRNDLLATGCAGVLYPVAAFKTSMPDIGVVRNIAWHADDLYLKILELINGIGVAYAPNSQNHPYQLDANGGDALCNVNVSGGRNDAILTELMQYYGFEPSVFRG